MDELELVIFDLAGTTVEDRGEVPFAFTAALAEHGIKVTSEQVRSVRGLSKRQALLQLIPAGPEQARLGEEAHVSSQAHLAQRYAAAGVRAISGAALAFRSLRSGGVRVALNTGFDQKMTELLLGALGWLEGMVDAVVCGDEVTQGRPAPYLIFRAMEKAGASSVEKVANVGDTTLDLKAGHHAGVRWNIGVLSGAHDRQAMEGAPHTHLLPSVAELTRLWAADYPTCRRRRAVARDSRESERMVQVGLPVCAGRGKVKAQTHQQPDQDDLPGHRCSEVVTPWRRKPCRQRSDSSI